MQNIKAIISNHDMSILHQNNKIKNECNCIKNKYCPLGRKCLSPNIVYQGKTTSSRRKWNDKSLLWNCRKVVQRFYNYTKLHTHEDYANGTELSEEYWEIIRNNYSKSTWSTVGECLPCNLSKRKCYLCLNEKNRN